VKARNGHISIELRNDMLNVSILIIDDDDDDDELLLLLLLFL